MVSDQDFHDRSVVANGLSLHYLDWGEAGRPPLLLLHGLSANAHVWDDYARQQRVRFHVLALDQRGHGNSAWSPEGAYSTFDHLADLAVLGDALELPPVTMIGSSMGGRNALAYAACYPERVARLVVVDIGPARHPEAPPVPPDPDREEAPMTFSSTGEAVAWMRRVYPSRTLELCRHRVQYNTRSLPDGRLVWKWDPALYLHQRAGDDLWPLMAEVRCPTLLLRGAQSMVLTRQTAARMVAALPDCRLVEIPDVGHNLVTDRPSAFREVVDAFLAEA